MRDVDGAKAARERLGDRDRAFLLCRLRKYYSDDGAMFPPRHSRKRRRVTIDGVEHRLVRVPKKVL